MSDRKLGAYQEVASSSSTALRVVLVAAVTVGCASGSGVAAGPSGGLATSPDVTSDVGLSRPTDDTGHATPEITEDAGQPPDSSTPPGLASAGTPLDPAAVPRAAVFMASCGEEFAVDNALGRLYGARTASTDAFARIAEEVACLGARSNGCEALWECGGLRLEHRQAGCPRNECQGGTSIRCESDGATFTRDCGKFGLTCDSSGSSQMGCTDPAPSKPCVSNEPACDSGRVVLCGEDSNERAGFDCAAAGLLCDAGCLGAGPACTSSFGAASATRVLDGIELGSDLPCRGKDLVLCLGGAEALLDCATVGIGFTCQTRGAISSCGLAAECSIGKNAECEGDSLVLCNAGRLEKVDCKALGFSGCDPTLSLCVPTPWSTLGQPG